ncbi:CHAT domain-containing protein [Actinoallomurus liliacearum]
MRNPFRRRRAQAGQPARPLVRIEQPSPTRQPSAWAAFEILRAGQLMESADGDRTENLLHALDILAGARTVAANGEDAATIGLAMAFTADAHIALDRDADDLENAVAWYTVAAHQLRHSNPREYVSRLIDLSEAYRARVHDLPWRNAEKAVSVLRAAMVRAARHGWPDLWARAALGLGAAYDERIVGDRKRNRWHAIRVLRGAVEGFTALGNDARQAQARVALAQALLNGDHITVADCDEAIAAASAALDWYRRGGDLYLQAVSQSILGGALTQRDSPDAPGFAAGISLLAEAARLLAADPDPGARQAEASALISLGHACTDRAEAGDAAEGQRGVQALSRALEIYVELGRPVECRGIGLDLGLLQARHLGDWTGATRAFEAAAEAHDVLLSLSPDQDTRVLESPLGQRVAGLLAYGHAVTGNPGAAAVALERVRVRAARQVIDIHRTWDPQFPAVPPVPADAWPLTEFRALVTRIRTLAPDFLRPPGLADLQAVAESGPPVAYVVITEFGSAWIVLHERAGVLLVPEVTSEALRQMLVNGYVQGQFFGEPGFEDALADCLERLGALTGPLRAWLDEAGIGELVVIPTGYANLVPLHVGLAGADRTITYVPSAAMLRDARENAAVASGRPGRLVAAAVTDGIPPLPYADAEVRQVATHFDDSVVLSRTGGGGIEFLAAATSATHLHIASHGYANAAHPESSYLALPGGARLHVADIIRQAGRLAGTRLAVLSACQSALTMNQPDELLTLPTVFVVAGVGGVIATLWPVPDLSTALLMDRLYARMTDGTSPACALRQAQEDLAAMTPEDVLRFRQAHGFGPQAGAGRSTSAASRARTPADPTASPAASSTPGPGRSPRRPFGHPFYWAGFVYIGALSRSVIVEQPPGGRVEAVPPTVRDDPVNDGQPFERSGVPRVSGRVDQPVEEIVDLGPEQFRVA